MSEFGNMSSDHIFQEVIEVSDEICNAWEIEFLESIGARLKAGCELTPPQRSTLERIYDKACRSAY